MNLEASRAKMKEILDNYTTTKTTGMQAMRETLNTACVASGAFALRPLGYGLMDAMERFQKLTKESNIKKGDGESANKPAFWRDVIAGSIKETYQEAFLKNEDGSEKSKMKKGMDFVKAWGKIARYAGMGATVTFNPENMTSSIESALGLLEGKQGLSEIGNSFQGNLERVAHVSLLKERFLGINHDNAIFPENTGLNHDNVIFHENPAKGINHDNAIFNDDESRISRPNEIPGSDHKENIVMKTEYEKFDSTPPPEPYVENENENNEKVASLYDQHLSNGMLLEKQQLEIFQEIAEEKEALKNLVDGGDSDDYAERIAHLQELDAKQVEIANQIADEKEILKSIVSEGGMETKSDSIETPEETSSPLQAEKPVGNIEAVKPEVISEQSEGPKEVEKIIPVAESKGIEQVAPHIDQMTKMKGGGSVKFDYDSKGEITGYNIKLSEYVKGESKNFMFDDSRLRLRQAPLPSYDHYQTHAQAELMADRTSGLINNQLNRYMNIYNELANSGHKKESRAVLGEMYRIMDLSEKNVGTQIYDRSKFPKL